ncbi:MAG TPA: methyltransferase domain-containing protein [Gaiellaceae bacterium]|nr:methyltransferase domain-containing protein [Gaiellaceae bacterium]
MAALYDEWSRTVVEDVGFYVEEARRSGGPVVELGVGTGRVAVPVAQAGVEVIGVDSSPGMLAVCRRAAEEAGVSGRVDLRVGNVAAPPVPERVPLVMSPFRAFLHLAADDERLRALRAVRNLLVPDGRFVFDVFAPGDEDIEETHGRWLEREPGIWERADWDRERRLLTLDVRGPSGEATLALAWLEPERWRELIVAAGLEIVAEYGWFDRRPYTGGEDTIWVAARPAA